MTCPKDYTLGVTLIECPVCEGSGQDCQHCDNGRFEVSKCPREYLGQEFIEAVNYAAISGKGDWPVAGGLLDQAAWFVSLKQHLDSEQNLIEAERMES